MPVVWVLPRPNWTCQSNWPSLETSVVPPIACPLNAFKSKSGF
jgi:hypothetical protein